MTTRAKEKRRTLDEIAAEMDSLVGRGDTEVLHLRADDLLVEALWVLGRGAAKSVTVERIVAAYTNVEKWYA